MPRFRTLDELDVAGKRVLLRADLNVPVKDGRVTDATRIERLAPTIAALIERGAKIVVMSHFGRPKGPDPSQSLRLLVEPAEGNGLRSASQLMIDKITTVSKKKLERRVGWLSDEDIVRVNRAVLVFLGFAGAGTK